MDDPRSKAPINWVDVVGGAVLGLLGSWLTYAVAFMVLYGKLGDHAATWVDTVVGLGALLAIPVVAGAMLIYRGRGQLGSGLLLGVAVGSIIGAGVCGASPLFV
jgi:hypothetical protein